MPSQETGQELELKRHGKVVYEANPSIAGGRFRTRITPSKTIGGSNAYMGRKAQACENVR
jgi:hypothetical protein